MKKLAIALVISLLAAPTGAQGHRITGNQVVIGSQRQWENWEFAPGTLEISSRGEVTPRFYHRNTNAVEDIVSFLRMRPPEGIKKDPEDIELIDALDAGSNRGDVVNVLDGDMSTYWEPDPLTGDTDLASQWWFSVDLGRYVIAKKLVLKFADEELGDPFLLFDVLVSGGEKPSANNRSPIPEYQTMQRILSPNKSKREFVIELPEDPQLNGKGIRFVQVIVTGTDSTRAQEMSQEEYELLAAADRGGIEYYKRLPDGRETAIDVEIYSLLDEERRGSIRYFRREHPRLAELEVWAEGDEILIETLARGGTVSATQTTSLNAMFDGDVVSKGALVQGFGSVRDPEGELSFDLGSFFWIDTYRIIFAGGFFVDYRLDFSDGNLAADGSLKWTTTAAVVQSSGQLSEGHDFELLKARYFRIAWRQWETGTGTFSNSALPVEIQLYGEGFQPEVTLESDLVTLGSSRNLLSVEWDADTPLGTKVLLQTRTGAIMDTLRTYFKKPLSALLAPKEVTKEQYEALSDSKKGDIIEEVRMGSDWSDWSEPYENAAGSPITSPSPRQFLIMRASLMSDDPAVSATLKEVRLKFGNPVAKGLLGEISPFLVDSLGIERPFSLFIRPDFDVRDPGFDQLLLTGPSDMNFRLEGVYGGSEEALMEEGDLTGLALDDVDIMATGPDSLRVEFAPVRPNSGIEVMRLDFRTALFGAGALLKASLQNSSAGGDAWQRVDAGDAAAEVGGNTTTLIGAVGTKDLIQDVAVLPNAFTPNGDGINDEVRFVFKVVRVGDDSPVEIDIYDLGGRLLRHMVERRALSTGEYEMRWDGRDDAGEIVPPGIYYARLRIDTDFEGADLSVEQILRTVSVAY